jgi:hypothetical protein
MTRAKLSKPAAGATTHIQAQFESGSPFSQKNLLIQAQDDESFIEISADDPEQDSTRHLEMLAQEIYNLLRQRLALEQERYGSGYPRRFR